MRRLLKYLPLVLVLGTLAAHAILLWVHAAYDKGLYAGIHGAVGIPFGQDQPITWELLRHAAPHVGLADVVNRMEDITCILLIPVVVAIPFCVPWKRNPLYRWHCWCLTCQVMYFPPALLAVIALFIGGSELVLTGKMSLGDGIFSENSTAAMLIHGLWQVSSLWYGTLFTLLQRTNPDLADASVRPAWKWPDTWKTGKVPRMLSGWRR